jgi:hypothetical protein
MPLGAARDAVIAVQAQVIKTLAAENAGLARQVADLAARVERLERLASRNSGNSSMPPSADDLPGRTPPRSRQPGGGRKRKPGKQPGAPGSHLAWSEHPDDTVPHFPAGACECGADLAGAAELIEALTGAAPSPGFVHQMIARAAAAVALIILAHVICADETPIRAGPAPRHANATCWSPVPGC